MSYPGQLTSIGALSLGSLSGVTGTVTAESDNPTLSPEYVDRTDALPVYVAATVAPLTLVVQIAGITTYAQRRTILRALRYPRTDETIRLRAWVGDPDSLTKAYIDVTIATINAQAGGITVTCVAPGGVWQAVSVTSAGPYTFSDDGAVAITSAGEAVTYATYKLAWTTQRATTTAGIGWKYRRQVTVTNNTERDWINRPICVDLGDTSAWVSGGKALSSGADLRVRVEGTDKYRTLVNWNRERSFVWFLVTIKSGDSQTVDVMYGNANANTWPDLSSKAGTRATYVAFDLEGDTGDADSGTANTLTDTARAWEVNRWRGGYVMITSGTGALQRRRILSNGPDTLTVSRNWTTNPAAGSNYAIWRSGVAVDGGAVSAKTASTVTDSSQAWGTNQWAGATVTFGGGTTADPTTMTVKSNTPTVLTFTSSFSTQPTVGDTYRIERYGVHTYAVDPDVYATTHQDLWRRNTYYSKPTRIWYGNQTPGGWTPTLYLDNGDDFAQSRVFDNGSGGGHSQNWRGFLRARRRRAQDATYSDEGQADGVSVYAPEGYQSMYYDYRFKNESGIAKFVVSVLDPGGEDWRDVVTDSGTYATLAAGTAAAAWRDLSSDDNPTRIYLGVLPADGVAIPSSVATALEAEARTYQRLELYLDLDGIGGLSNSIFSAGSEVEIYDLGVTLRLGGGEESVKTAPWDELVIGGTDHKIHITADEELWITTDPEDERPFAAVYDTDVLQYACPWAVRAYRYESDGEGNAVGLIARQIMPVTPQTNLVTNPTFASDITGWEAYTTTGGVTVAWSRDAGVYYDAAGSLKAVVSAAPAGPWTAAYITSDYIEVTPEQVYNLSAAVRSTNASYRLLFAVALYDSSLTPLVGGGGLSYTLAAADTWYPIGFTLNSSDATLAYVRVYVGISWAGAVLGTAYFDDISMGETNLFVTETAMGVITLEAEYRDRFLS